MNKKHGLKILQGILFAILLGLSALNIFYMMTYHILDFYYINYALIVVMLLVLILLFVSWLRSKGQKRAIFFSLIYGVVLGLVFVQIHKMVRLFNTFHENASIQVQTMSVAVLKDSEIKDVRQLGNEPVMAPLDMDKANIDGLMNQILAKYQVGLNLQKVDAYADAYDQLIEGKAKGIILNSAYENLIEEQDPDYSLKIQKIYETSIEEQVPQKPQVSIIEQKKEHQKITKDNHTLQIYLSGIDTYGPITAVSRSDINILMTVNLKTNQILLTNTPRDAYLPIAGGGQNQYDKLTHAGIYGIESSVGTLENLYGIDIDYYARINFTSFIKLIDLIGGIEVDNDQAFTSHIGGYDFPVGRVYLDSERALGFVRERYSLSAGDHDRGKNQQKVIAAIIQKLAAIENIGKMEEIILELSNSIQTDMPLFVVMDLANKQVQNHATYQIHSQSVTGTGVRGLRSHAMPNHNLYMLQLDEGSVAQAKEEIYKVVEDN